ncbi:PQQ-binding-like beta-propeller repeat protein [bacterium]|nr:PQQ-binding-like beta-propeller repeat protein [bacterium]
MQSGERQPIGRQGDGWRQLYRSQRLVRIAIILLPLVMLGGWLVLRLSHGPTMQALHSFELPQDDTHAVHCEVSGSGPVMLYRYFDSVFIYDPASANCAICPDYPDFECSIPASVSPSGMAYMLSTQLVALENDGTIRWRFASDNYGFRAVVATPERVYATDHGNALYALDHDGQLLWKFDQGWETDCGGCTGWEDIPLAVGRDGSAVYETRSYMGGSAPRIVAVSPDGELAWRINYGSGNTPSLLSSGLVGDYVLTLFRDPANNWSVTARDWQGRKLWVEPSDFVYGFRSVRQLEDYTLLDTEEGIVCMEHDGTVRWQLADPQNRFGLPCVLPNGRLLATERDSSSLLDWLGDWLPDYDIRNSSSLGSIFGNANSYNLAVMSKQGRVLRRLRLPLEYPATPVYCDAQEQVVVANGRTMLVLRASEI